jgi:S-formylglutathione hydrolase
MRGTWCDVEIAGKPADVYEPPGPPAPRFGVLYLHSYGLETLRGPHADAYPPLFDELGLACVCPHGGHCWWLDRVCPEFDSRFSPERHLLDNVLPLFRQRWEIGERGVGLFGVSMGGVGALRLGFRYPDIFPVVAALAAAVEYHELYGSGTPLDGMYDSKEQCRQDSPPMHIDPGRQPPHLFFAVDPADADWLRGNERLHEKLAALGVAHEFDLTTRAGGHSWSYFNHMAGRVVHFLKHGLEQESRRLL